MDVLIVCGEGVELVLGWGFCCELLCVWGSEEVVGEGYCGVDWCWGGGDLGVGDDVDEFVEDCV